MIQVRLLAGTLLVLSLGLLGCSAGGNPNANARVSGGLSYKGQPIKGGAIRFHTPEGVAYDGLISSDGTYSATDVPAGELVVTVETESISPERKAPKGAEAERRMRMMKSSMQPPPGRGGPVADPSVNYIKIPKKYSNPKTSPLTVTLTPGRQVHNFDLSD